MTNGGDQPPGLRRRKSRNQPVLSWRARVETLQRSLLRRPLAIVVMDVLRAYARAGGGMTAASLAYFAFFTTVPALLLFVSLLGVLVEDQQRRMEIVEALVDRLDPIRDLSLTVIDGLADAGRTGTVLGVLGLLWGASGFYGALQSAMQRAFPGPRSRDFVHTRIRGVLAVLVVLGGMLAAVVAVIVVPLLSSWLDERCRDLDDLDVPLVAQACSLDLGDIGAIVAIGATIAVASAAALLVYVAVPPDGPTLRQALWPALIVGTAVGLLTSLFGLIAPFLVQQWLALGIVGSVFVSLVWFDLVFQALLYGAAFSRLRRDRHRNRTVPPRL